EKCLLPAAPAANQAEAEKSNAAKQSGSRLRNGRRRWAARRGVVINDAEHSSSVRTLRNDERSSTGCRSKPGSGEEICDRASSLKYPQSAGCGGGIANGRAGSRRARHRTMAGWIARHVIQCSREGRADG